ncbi:hypothetical protein FIU94_04835 [Sulfitobacter sp. THAF37]|uniref:DUF883 family protein n=1 Tax=Sulfitobacter sp. THAF37 TaxID=2587855 RepID=UPI0012A9C590|nr:DUF883 domain-containing protein [Sulfitobacter sp. THAF37]QFT58141.1 hypothetical protein FIU94_04835 [Sulfitobacter sp. THAF37]
MSNVTKAMPSKAADEISKAGKVTVDDLSVQLQVLKDDIAALTSTVGSYSQERASVARDTVQQKASELSTSAQARAKEGQKQAEDFIRTQPGTAIGIAAGAGFLIGLLTARR